METETEGALISYGTLFFVILIVWIGRIIKEYREDREFWRSLDERIDQRNREFNDVFIKGLEQLSRDPAFVKIIQGINWTPVNKTEVKPKLTRFQKVKQWVINQF